MFHRFDVTLEETVDGWKLEVDGVLKAYVLSLEEALGLLAPAIGKRVYMNVESERIARELEEQTA